MDSQGIQGEGRRTGGGSEGAGEGGEGGEAVVGRGAEVGEDQLGRGGCMLGTRAGAEGVCGDGAEVWSAVGVCLWVGKGTFLEPASVVAGCWVGEEVGWR